MMSKMRRAKRVFVAQMLMGKSSVVSAFASAMQTTLAIRASNAGQNASLTTIAREHEHVATGNAGTLAPGHAESMHLARLLTISPCANVHPECEAIRTPLAYHRVCYSNFNF